MEFTTLTRRVAEATGADAAAIEPAPLVDRRLAAGRTAMPAHGPDLREPAAPRPARRPARSCRAEGKDESAPLAALGKPQDLVAARKKAACLPKIDPQAYALHPRPRGRCERWVAEARETGIVAFAPRPPSLDPMQAELVGISLAHRARAAPPTCRSATARGDGDLLGGGLREGPDPDREALAR